MNVIADSVRALTSASWEYWWFPGFQELLNMLAFAFWWELVFVIAAIPVIIIIFSIGNS